MNFSDFEPSNGSMLKRNMINGAANQPVKRRRRRLVKKIHPSERTMNIEGEKKQIGEANYPDQVKGKIFGMQPKKLALTLGIIVLGVFIINLTGKSEGEEVVYNGIA